MVNVQVKRFTAKASWPVKARNRTQSKRQGWVLRMCQAERRPTSSSSARDTSKTLAILNEESSSTNSEEQSTGYELNMESYAKPPRWLKHLKSEEEETRIINYLLNLSVIGGAGLAFAVKFFAVDADIWRGWTLMEILSTVPKDNWNLYEASLASHPVISKACISGVVYGLGDLTAQTYEGRTLDDLDRGRIIRSSLTGFIGHGPMSHWWYITADEICAPLGDGLLSISVKLLLDQTLWAFIWLFSYYSLLGGLNFDSPPKIYDTMKASWWPVLKAGWRFWPFAHMITYGVIPQQHRLLWVDICEIVWVTILSFIGNQKREEALKTSQEAVDLGTESASPLAVTGQVSCTLPTSGVGGNAAEEILRSMDTERTVCIQNEAEDSCAPAEAVFSKDSEES